MSLSEGNRLYKEGNLAAAEKAFRKALDLDPKYAAAWANLGALLKEQKRYDEAEKACKRAVEIDDKSAQAWNNLGTVFESRERYDEAEKAYRRSIKLDPKQAPAWMNLGNLLEAKILVETGGGNGSVDFPVANVTATNP